MKNYLFGISSFLIMIFMVACVAPIKADTDKRDVATFTKVSLGISANVYISQGNTQSLELRGDADDLENIETEVKDGRRKIRTKSKLSWNWKSSKIEIFITMKELEGLSVAGSGKIVTQDNFKTNELDLDVSGSGKIDANVNADDIDIDISGSGSVTLKGASNNSSVQISGSGRLTALEHKGNSYDIQISGSGSCKINVVNEISARISGSGSVRYTGDPEKVRSNVSGSGSVKKMN
jgi:putative autotransporter adhesin-like protein